jgi:hypothetical protein
VDHLRGGWSFRGKPQHRQVRGNEVGAAAHVHLGEDRAILDASLGNALQVAAVVQQRDQHPEHRAPRAEPVGLGAAAVMPVHEPRHGERHVEGVAHVVVQRVAREVARVVAFEQRLEVVEGARERRQVRARVAHGEQGQHGVADPRRILDVHAIGDVILV